jgi:hypothetical protein
MSLLVGSTDGQQPAIFLSQIVNGEQSHHKGAALVDGDRQTRYITHGHLSDGEYVA